MKTYLYNDLDHPDPIRITDEEILELYWDYWVGRMRLVGKEHLISEENCIDDWVCINWAWEEK